MNISSLSPRVAFLNTMEFLRRRKAAYQMVFRSTGSETVLTDLARFCRAAETTITVKERDLIMMMEGRRQVWLRIQDHLNFTPAEIARLYRAAVLNPNGDYDG